MLKVIEEISKSISVILDLLNIEPVQKAVFESFPDFDDQIYVMAMTVSRNQIPIVVLSNHASELPNHWLEMNMNLAIVKKKSLKAFYISKIYKYIFFTHGSILFKNTSKKQKVVNLWHGIPLKKIGAGVGQKMPSSNFILATSRKMAYLIEETFSPHERLPTVLTFGLPRTDLLKPLAKQNTTMKKLLWMPTYRKSKIGHIRNDGLINETGIGLSTDTLLCFDKGLSQLGIKVELLMHPMADGTLPNMFGEITLSEFDREKDSLYLYLNEFDGLITDYSSVSVDYLVTQKPLFLFAPDYDEYASTRGLNCEIESLFGLPMNKSVEELLKSLSTPEALSKILESSFDRWYEYKGRNRSNLIWKAIK